MSGISNWLSDTIISCAGGEAASINITNCNIRSSRCITCIARNNSRSNIIHRGDNIILHRKSDKTDRQCGRGTDSIFGIETLVTGDELCSTLLVCAALDDELGDADDEVVWRVGGAAAVITPSASSRLEASFGDMSTSMAWCRGDIATLPSSALGYDMGCWTSMVDGFVDAVMATIAAGLDVRGNCAVVL